MQTPIRAIAVERTPNPDGGATYTITVNHAADLIITGGAALEKVDPARWVIGALAVRVGVLGRALGYDGQPDPKH